MSDASPEAARDSRIAFAPNLTSDIVLDFAHSPVAVGSGLVILIFVLGAVLAPWLAPHDPFDLASIDLMNSFKPPFFMQDGDFAFPLGTDHQGRDVLSGIMYGARISLEVGVSAILFATALGVSIGLSAGYMGGLMDAVLMRLADVQLSFPAILVALLVDGVVSATLPGSLHEQFQIYVLIFAIGISKSPQFARIVRGSTLVERGREYVMAARVIGLSSWRIVLTHILPNVLGPVLIIGTLNLGFAIVSEATLSFLGVGLPPTEPSLGTLIRIGNDYLFSGEWWMTIFPGLALAMMLMSMNMLGDWLRDALNPRLR
ncbi:MAG: ABC transporter permease [Acetobacteraceae bacterium]|nr:ABC transporter permease [Acetobacteraceae bacterium]